MDDCITSVHPETAQGHSEPFGRLRACSESVEGINSARNLSDPSNQEILGRLAPQNDIQKLCFRMDTDDSHGYRRKALPSETFMGISTEAERGYEDILGLYPVLL